MTIPSTPGWDSRPTDLNGEPREFATSFFTPADDGTETEYGGTIVARSFEEANQVAASIRCPRTVVRGVLGGRVHMHTFN